MTLLIFFPLLIARPIKTRLPIVTYTLCMLCAIGATAYHLLKQNFALFLRYEQYLAFVPAKPNIIGAIVSIFMHSGFKHFISNTIALAVYGSAVERIYGRIKTLIIFFLSACLGKLLFFYSIQHIYAWELTRVVGASGGVFGLMAAAIVASKHIRTSQIRVCGFLPVPTPPIATVLPFVGYNLYAMFHIAMFHIGAITLGKVNIIAHVTGILTGSFLGILLLPDSKLPTVEEVLAQAEENYRKKQSGNSRKIRNSWLYS